nr:hypothetical protein [Mycoplasmopsis bovis]
MTLGEVFDNLVKKVNREDSKITIDKAQKNFTLQHYLKSANSITRY